MYVPVQYTRGCVFDKGIREQRATGPQLSGAPTWRRGCDVLLLEDPSFCVPCCRAVKCLTPSTEVRQSQSGPVDLGMNCFVF